MWGFECQKEISNTCVFQKNEISMPKLISQLFLIEIDFFSKKDELFCTLLSKPENESRWLLKNLINMRIWMSKKEISNTCVFQKNEISMA